METAYYTLRRRIKDGIVPRSRVSGTILIPKGYIKREMEGINEKQTRVISWDGGYRASRSARTDGRVPVEG